MSKEVEFIGTTDLRGAQQRRRSARLSGKGKSEDIALKPCITKKNKRKTRRSMSDASSSGASSIHETRSASKKRRVSVASRTTNRRSRFSSTTPTDHRKKETQKSKDFSELKKKSFASSSFVVTPCQLKRNLSPSLNSSSSLSSESHPSMNFTSKEILPKNVCDIDEYFSKVDHTYNNHNSGIVLDSAFMRDYGKEHFYYSSLREQKETSTPSLTESMNNSSTRITRSKRQILDGFQLSDSSTTSSVSCYESFTSSNKTSRRVKKKASIQDPYFDYMKNQPCLSAAMRTLLIDWFVELSEEYKLKPETLHLSVRILDRVLSKSEKRSQKEDKGVEPKKKKGQIKKLQNSPDCSNSSQSETSNESGTSDDDPVLCISSEEEEEEGSDDEKDRQKYKGFVVRRQMLQCVGCASMLIAAKLEEVKAPSPSDFSYISDSTYTPKQIRRMEMKICTHLQFQMREITPMSFFQRFVRASREGDTNPRNEMLEHLCHYLLELSLLEYELVGTKSSLIMSSVIYLARATLGIRNHTQDGTGSMKSSSSYTSAHSVGEYWSPTLEYYTGYEIWGMKDVIHVLHKLQSNAGDRDDKLKSVFQKYKSVKHMRVALKTSPRLEELGI